LVSIETFTNIHHFSLCSWDYLKIVDGNNQTIGVFCGQLSGETVYVTGPYAVISFHTDFIIRGRGYELFFSQVLIGKYNENLTLFCAPSLEMFVLSGAPLRRKIAGSGAPLVSYGCEKFLL